MTQWVAFVWPLVIAPDPNMFLLTTGPATASRRQSPGQLGAGRGGDGAAY